MPISSRNRKRRRRSRGSAVVEMALCLPLLAFLVLATVEACNLIYLQQAITVAAYEGARTAIVPGANSSNVRSQVQQVLTDRRVRGATTRVLPSNLDALELGDYVSVQVDVDFDQNRFLPAWIFGGRQLTARVEMMNEF